MLYHGMFPETPIIGEWIRRGCGASLGDGCFSQAHACRHSLPCYTARSAIRRDAELSYRLLSHVNKDLHMWSLYTCQMYVVRRPDFSTTLGRTSRVHVHEEVRRRETRHWSVHGPESIQSPISPRASVRRTMPSSTIIVVDDEMLHNSPHRYRGRQHLPFAADAILTVWHSCPNPAGPSSSSPCESST